jgi:hypothetical protein
MAEASKYSITTYERRPGYWRAAITPIRGAGKLNKGETTSIVTPDDFSSEIDANVAAKKIIGKL